MQMAQRGEMDCVPDIERTGHIDHAEHATTIALLLPWSLTGLLSSDVDIPKALCDSIEMYSNTELNYIL